MKKLAKLSLKYHTISSNTHLISSSAALQPDLSSYLVTSTVAVIFSIKPNIPEPLTYSEHHTVLENVYLGFL